MARSSPVDAWALRHRGWFLELDWGKAGSRFSRKIMLKRRDEIMIRSDLIGSMIQRKGERHAHAWF
jgi:hypothetical protein